MRPDVVPVGTKLEPTMVKLRTVTGELAPVLGRGVVAIRVGGLSVDFWVWVAEVQDPCILGLDFLRAARCVLDLGRNTLAFPGGPTVEMQEELWQLLWDFKDIFALTEEEVGLTHLVQHEIDTGDAQPIKTCPRCLPLAHQAAADSAIDEMLKAGIIEPSDSPWASGVVMVNKKKSTKMRFCVDYRPLNSVTKKDSYPLPHIDESLDLVSGSSWFSSFGSAQWVLAGAPQP
ncbi:hypothetical protein L3Q82_002556 [Scortum barcoo]|uniref:Uncharacterized protein n=1 Tax=Scortum barcoo TaxID=214431 RepID=A0ACB8VYJ5_9TELE|nr:hypothetical protein L3Q82_002556 [Scortum barcoo]